MGLHRRRPWSGLRSLLQAREPVTTVLLLAFASVSYADCRSAPQCFDDGLALFVEEEYKDSGRAFEMAVEAEPDNPDYLVWQGRAWGRRAERATGFAKIGALSLAKRVRESFEKAIEIDPDHMAGLESLLAFYVNAPGIVGGGVDKAEPLADRMAAISPAEGRRAWASIYQAREEFAEAEAALREAVELEPDNVEHVLSLASFLARRGRFDESDKLYREAFEQEPESPLVWYSRAKELVRADRETDEARRLLERYLATPLVRPDAEPYSEARKLLKEI